MALLFQDPCTILLAGSTGSGKTHFVSQLLYEDMFENEPKCIHYCYGAYQKKFDEMSSKCKNIQFHHGLPGEKDLEEMCGDYEDHVLIILDDLGSKVMQSKVVQDLVTVKSHHSNCSVIILVQNAFEQGRCSRSISLNCHYTILLKNMRDVGQISYLGRQLFGAGRGKTLEEAYLDCMKDNFGYLVIDLHPRSDERFRLRSKIFPEDQITIYKLK